MLLSVVSALARLDLDPWQETADLARLPRKTATERLAAFIVSLPDPPSAHLDTGAIAASLIARLPHQHGSNVLSAKRSPELGIPAAIQSFDFLYLALVLMVFLGSLGFAESQRSAPISKAPAPTAREIIPQSPSSTGGPYRSKARARGDTMTNEKNPPSANDQPEPARLEQPKPVGPQQQQSDANQVDQQPAPGRRPLFRT